MQVKPSQAHARTHAYAYAYAYACTLYPVPQVDLSYNSFGEESGKYFGDMLNGHSVLLDVNLKWNALKARGGAAVAEGLKANQVLSCVHVHVRMCM